MAQSPNSSNFTKVDASSGYYIDGTAVLTAAPAKYVALAGTTTAYAGGGTSNAFTVTGLAATDIVSAVIRASTNAVSIAKAVPTANTLTVTFSADPGAATTVDYVAFRAIS